MAVNGIVSGPAGNGVGVKDRLAVLVVVKDVDGVTDGDGATVSSREASMSMAGTETVLK